MTQINQKVKTRIWDLPTRLFHVLLMLCVVGLVITGNIGDSAMSVHFYLGYAVLTLLLFRVIWGVVGGHWSRFINFIPRPQKLIHYLRNFRNPDVNSSVGHNPLGAISVLTFLIVLSLQGLSGLMSDDDISVSGPWTALVPNSWVEFATRYHAKFGFPLIIILISVHLFAVLYHLHVMKQNLIRPMIDGDKILPTDTPASIDSFKTRAIAFAVCLACAFVVYLFVTVSAA
jgi:cytochrome b